VSLEELNEVISMSKESASVKQKQKKGVKKVRNMCDYDINAQNPKYIQAVNFIIYLV
jgi:hypothetical protein